MGVNYNFRSAAKIKFAVSCSSNMNRYVLIIIWMKKAIWIGAWKHIVFFKNTDLKLRVLDVEIQLSKFYLYIISTLRITW